MNFVSQRFVFSFDLLNFRFKPSQLLSLISNLKHAAFVEDREKKSRKRQQAENANGDLVEEAFRKRPICLRRV